MAIYPSNYKTVSSGCKVLIRFRHLNPNIDINLTIKELWREYFGVFGNTFKLVYLENDKNKIGGIF